jgi:uncharacterized protein (UPF0210 family)
MKVRAVTVFAAIDPSRVAASLSDAGTLAEAVRQALEHNGLEVQTVRLALPPVDTVGTGVGGAARLHDLALALDTESPTAGFGFVSVGTIDTVTLPDGAWQPLLEAAPTLVGATKQVAITATVGTRTNAGAGTIAVGACRMSGDVVTAIARTGNDGFGNLRFAAIANVAPHVPFFPAAFHDRQPSAAFGLALECADVVESAFAGAATLEHARTRLVNGLSATVNRVAGVARGIAAAHPEARFAGVDFSPAPFPAPGSSIGNAFEALGLPAFGGPGTTFVASFLTECLHEVARRTEMVGQTAAGSFRPTGFSGLMMPVLEDATLAVRAAEGHLSVERLLLASTVCGLGLDTVPLPGDIDGATLGSVILDMATLAVRLDKPLTARLFPVPGKRAGDRVSWDFPYFAPSVAIPIHGLPASGAIASATRHHMRIA